MAIPGYKILKKIGDGGMSSVYLSIQLSVGREVALKVLSPELRNEKNFIEKFFREANIVGTLSHPNIVSIYDVGTHDGHYYIAMDYLPGDACSDRIKAAAIDLHTALRIMRDIASALDYAHERGFVHCDVKPDNILFRHDGSAVLTDFGIAIATSLASRGALVGVAGTPHYMSPEQTQGSGIDGRADLYSLGVVFYEMLVHEVPFKGKDAVAVAMKHMTAPIPQLPEHLREFQPVINRLLAKKPASRFQNGRELIAAIDAIAEVQESPRSRSGGDLLQSTFAAPASALSALGRVASDKFDVLRRLQFSPRYGLVLQGAGAHLLDLRSGSANVDREGDTTSFNTTAFRRNLGEALQQNMAQRLVGPLWIALLFLALLIAIAATQFGELFESTFWRRLSGPEIVSTVMAPAAVPQPPTPAEPAPPAPPPSAATMPASSNAMTEAPASDAANSTAPNPEDSATAQPSEQQIVAAGNATIATDAAAGGVQPQDATVAVAADPAVAPAPVEPPKTYKFTLNVNPADADIRVTNIKPKYTPAMELPAGKYHVIVSKLGYVPQDSWVVIRKKDLIADIALQQIIVKPRYAAGQDIQDSLGEAGLGPAMIVVPRGGFTMGNNDLDNAAPTRVIRVDNLIAIARHETTNDEYAAYAKAAGKSMVAAGGKDGRNHPVVMVNWQQANDYARWLSETTGQRYRLPTEAEWEYAARASSAGNYPWGNKSAKKKANCSLGCDSEYIRFLSSSSAPVEHYSPNAWGIYDTTGNVAEWVQDCYHPSYVGAPPVATAWVAGSCDKRTLRGGSFKSKAEEITNASRAGESAATQKKYIGFRVVREIVE